MVDAAGSVFGGESEQGGVDPPRAGQLRLVPLGGLGEVGMNCLALEQADGILLIDCGITFPEEDCGIDVLHPRFDYLHAVRHRVSGIFLTHAHEDHIGALPFLLSRLSVPVWGPAHAIKLARRRLRERLPEGSDPTVDFRIAKVGQEHVVGPFVVEPIRVAHSIVEATALRVQTCAGTVVHSGDFNFDPEPPDGEPSDEKRLKEIGDAGVALLLSDSTNVDGQGQPGSEREVATTLEEIVSEAPGRVVVGLFSSNVQRLISLGHIARRSGRRIALLGRSLRTHVEAASDLGHLVWNGEHRLTNEELATCPPERLLLLAGGTQAEAGSALERLARGAHPALQLEAGDSVILSSRIIPGNDRRVSRMMSDLLRHEVKLHAANTCREVHTSGHANRQELSRMLDLLRPRAFVPVHGTRHHLHNHAELARQRGARSAEVIENGQTLILEDERLSRGPLVPTGRVARDRWGRVLSASALRERAALARGGHVNVYVVTDAESRLAAPVSLSARGVPGLERREAELCQELERIVRERSRAWARRGLDLAGEVGRVLSWRIDRELGQRPVVDVTVSSLR